MKIRFSCKLSGEEQLIITVGEKRKILDERSPSVTFEVSEDIHFVTVESSTIQINIKWLAYLLYFLTIFIQGVFHILFLNTDSMWYLNVHPIHVKATFELNVSDNQEVMLTYTKSQYNTGLKRWELPSISCSPEFQVNLLYLKNLQSFHQQFNQFIKKIISIAAVV